MRCIVLVLVLVSTMLRGCAGLSHAGLLLVCRGAQNCVAVGRRYSCKRGELEQLFTRCVALPLPLLLLLLSWEKQYALGGRRHAAD